MKEATIVLYIALALVAGLITGQTIEMHKSANAVKSTVKAICDYGRGTISGEAEEACGLALDFNGLEYSCPSYESPTTLCTVTERK